MNAAKLPELKVARPLRRLHIYIYMCVVLRATSPRQLPLCSFARRSSGSIIAPITHSPSSPFCWRGSACSPEAPAHENPAEACAKFGEEGTLPQLAGWLQVWPVKAKLPSTARGNAHPLSKHGILELGASIRKTMSSHTLLSTSMEGANPVRNLTDPKGTSSSHTHTLQHLHGRELPPGEESPKTSRSHLPGTCHRGRPFREFPAWT